MKIHLRLSLAALICTSMGVAPVALATKPCLPAPCDAAGGGTDLNKCNALADWIAVGRIAEVVHHEAGQPLMKDFAEFKFIADTWEKGEGRAGQEIRFQVGWCENTRPVPRDSAGKFRFYGKKLPADPSVPNQYLHFEALN